MWKWLGACLMALFMVGGTYSSAKAVTITLGTSSAVFCFRAGGGSSMAVTVTSSCGQPNSATVTGSASSTIPPTAGTYTLQFLDPNILNPAFSLVSPSTIVNTTTFAVLPNSPQFGFTYKNGPTTFLAGSLQFTQFVQTYISGNNAPDPVTTATALFTYSSGTLTDFSGGGTAIMHFSLGGGESLLAMFNQTGGSSGTNWDGFSSKQITDGTLTSVSPVVPEPSSLLLLGSGLAGLAAWRWRRNRPLSV